MVKAIAWTVSFLVFMALMAVAIIKQNGAIQIFGFIFLATAYQLIERSNLFRRGSIQDSEGRRKPIVRRVFVVGFFIFLVVIICLYLIILPIIGVTC